MLHAPKYNAPVSPDVEEDLLVESDSDSAPEDIGFEMGKATALKQVKDALLQMDVKKVKAKERRKRQEELFKQQKVSEPNSARNIDQY